MRLERFAAAMDLIVVADDLPFDVWADASLPNTEIRFCRRDGSRKKSFGRVVLPSILNPRDAVTLAATLGGNGLGPDLAGIEPLSILSGIEIMVVVSTLALPTDEVPDLPSLAERLRQGREGPGF